MGRRRRIVNKIPSDSESVDGLCDSNDEDEVLDRRVDHVAPSINNLLEDEAHEEEIDNETTTTDLNKSEIWRSTSIPKTDLPFSRSHGPIIPDSASSPKDIFLCLFPESLLDVIVEQTNLFISQKKSKGDLITKDELKIFIAINIHMGYKKLPSYRDYWSNSPQFHDSYISSLMTVNRFGFFLSHLHINDNSKEPAKGDPEYDKLYKLRPLLDTLSETFRECWKPSHHQAIDESMMKFKERSSMKQYMPAKPTKRGYKVWTRADESGFVCQFQIYTGKTDSPEKQLGARVVRDLTRDLVGHNHQVYFDNFFTGVELLISLKQDNILACGTVRSNRANLPKSDKSDKKMVIGEYEYKTSTSGLTWIKWMDKKPVYFLSNFHDPTEVTVVNRRQKDGTLTPVNSPVLCSDYNTHMGYVDYADRAISTYQIDRKSKKWWFRIFWHFIDLCICNGFILYKEKQIKPLLSLKKFRMRLVEQLVVHKIPTPKGRKRTAPNTPCHAKIKVPDEKRLSNAAHMPQVSDT
ncbi:piggyBac transposable element-derived protein 4-like [Phymastichus coffea]|uniref:piggyBac transposable element-derived protein 4-like n=2 Tax=Phymastichus coffea TaxID=108790 RepID=UPI00273C76CE|nr:piggyBac transposable element-derived protein 4-like [Phymastichus coffea]